MPETKRILTGIRPTGSLHLGHYAGALENWLELQHTYDCCFLIADYQVSDRADDPRAVRCAVWDVALDGLAVGLEPMRQRRAQDEGHMGRVCEVLEHGAVRARAIARTTMDRVHDAFDLDYLGKYR